MPSWADPGMPGQHVRFSSAQKAGYATVIPEEFGHWKLALVKLVTSTMTTSKDFADQKDFKVDKKHPGYILQG
jgi:hypothetical protein